MQVDNSSRMKDGKKADLFVMLGFIRRLRKTYSTYASATRTALSDSECKLLWSSVLQLSDRMVVLKMVAVRGHLITTTCRRKRGESAAPAPRNYKCQSLCEAFREGTPDLTIGALVKRRR